MKPIINNPLFIKDTKSLFRSKSSSNIIILFSFALAFIVFYEIFLNNNYFTSSEISWFKGENIFWKCFGLQAILTLIAALTTAAASFSSEREQLTFDILISSPLRPEEIINTRLASSLLPFMTVMFISLPVYAIAYFLGGISVIIVFKLLLFNIFAMLAFAVFGLQSSLFSKKTFASMLFVIFISIFFMFLTHNEILGVLNPAYIITKINSEENLCLYNFTISAFYAGIIFYFLLFMIFRLRSVEFLKRETDRSFCVSRMYYFVFLLLFEFYLIGYLFSSEFSNETQILRAVFQIYIVITFLSIILLPAASMRDNPLNIKSNIEFDSLNFIQKIFFKRTTSTILIIFSLIVFASIICSISNIVIFKKILRFSQIIKSTLILSIFFVFSLLLSSRIYALKFKLIKKIFPFIIIGIFFTIVLGPTIISEYNLNKNSSTVKEVKSDYSLLVSPFLSVEYVLAPSQRFNSSLVISRLNKKISPVLLQSIMYLFFCVVLYNKRKFTAKTF